MAAHDMPPCCLPWMPHAHGKLLSIGQAAEHRLVSPSSRRAAGGTPARDAALGAVVEECVASKARLQAAITAAALPANFLDLLLNELGGPQQVAEMTGRWAVGCVVRVCVGWGGGGGGGVDSAVWACCLRAGGAMLARRHCWPGIPELICAEQTQTCRPMLCNTWRHLHSMEHSDVTCCAARACAECKWAPSGARRGAWPPQMRARAAAGAGAWWRTRAGAACSSCAPRPTAPSWIRSTCARLVRRSHWLTDCRAALRDCRETGARACRCKSCRAPGRGCFLASSQAGQWTAL